jgi:hypothetical protein
MSAQTDKKYYIVKERGEGLKISIVPLTDVEAKGAVQLCKLLSKNSYTWFEEPYSGSFYILDKGFNTIQEAKEYYAPPGSFFESYITEGITDEQ